MMMLPIIKIKEAESMTRLRPKFLEAGPANREKTHAPMIVIETSSSCHIELRWELILDVNHRTGNYASIIAKEKTSGCG